MIKSKKKNCFSGIVLPYMFFVKVIIWGDRFEMWKRRSIVNYDLALRIDKLFNIFGMATIFSVFWFVFYAGKVISPFYKNGNIALIMIFTMLYLTYGRTYSAFALSCSRITDLIFGQMLALLFSNILMYFMFWLLIRHIPEILPLLLCFIIQSIFAMIWCKVSHLWYFNRFPNKNTIILYKDKTKIDGAIAQYGLDVKYKVSAKYTVKEFAEYGINIISKADVVFLIDMPSHERNQVLKYCLAHGIEVYSRPKIGDVIMSGAWNSYLFHMPLLKVTKYSPKIEYLVAKRVFDIIFSAFFLVATSPIFIIVSIAIKISDRGPVFYRQTRLTKDGKEFQILKFRSMRVDAEKDGVARLSSGDNDPRVTKVGYFIRKCRIDELPQLLNILKGDMSIVGPRPERPMIAQQYEKELPEFSLRLQVKAGLTGLAQVYGKYNTTPYDKLIFDLIYISKPSIAEDLKIIFATVKILFASESTEGIEPLDDKVGV